MSAPLPVDFFESLARDLNKFGLRFSVCRADGKHSEVWRAWGKKNDFYIGARPALGILKISLHSDHNSRLAFTNEYHTDHIKRGSPIQPKREFVEWLRPPTPEIGAVHVVSIIFPLDYLACDKPVGKPRKKIFLFEANAPGHAVEFGLFLSRESAATLEEKLLRIGKPLFRTTLENGDTVTLVTRLAPFDAKVIPTPERIAGAMTLIEPGKLIGSGTEQNNLTMMFWDDPNISGALRIVEIGGVAVRRN